MSSPTLVITDPPHGPVDHEAVASVLSLSTEDAEAKVGFPAPEILKATDLDRAGEAADGLRAAGLDVAVVDGSELGGIPWPERVYELSFEDERLVAGLADGTAELRYDMPVLGVYCRPPAPFLASMVQELTSGTAAPAFAETADWMPRLDLYAERGNRLLRLSIVQELPSENGPDAAARAARAEELTAVLEELARRFERIELDRRLENLRPRRRFIPGETGFDQDLRKLYSFGTLLLRHALESISPELRDVTQFEYATRLAWVLHRHSARSTP